MVDLANWHLLCIIYDKIKLIGGPDTVLVALELLNMEGTPARIEARRVDDSVGRDTECAVGTDLRNTACPREVTNGNLAPSPIA